MIPLLILVSGVLGWLLYDVIVECGWLAAIASRLRRRRPIEPPADPFAGVLEAREREVRANAAARRAELAAWQREFDELRRDEIEAWHVGHSPSAMPHSAACRVCKAVRGRSFDELPRRLTVEAIAELVNRGRTSTLVRTTVGPDGELVEIHAC